MEGEACKKDKPMSSDDEHYFFMWKWMKKFHKDQKVSTLLDLVSAGRL